MPEFSDEQARVLLGSQQLLDKLLKNPKTKRETEKLVKTLYPDTVTTEDIAKPYVERIDGMEKRFDAFMKKMEGDEADSKFNKQIEALKKRGFSDDGIEKIKELMVKKLIPDAEVAADHWEKQNPPKSQAPSSFQPANWGIGAKTDDPSLKELFTDPDAWAEKEAQRAWDEEVAKKGQIIS
jgi:hypothetical protein